MTTNEESFMTLILSSNCITNAVRSYVLSKRYIYIMLKVSAINILYHRVNIDEKQFKTKIFHDIKYKLFRPKCNNSLIRGYFGYIKACKDAIDKNHLKDFYLYLVDENTREILENYKFSFKYENKKNNQVAQTDESLRAMTLDFLKNLEELGKNTKLTGITVKVEMTYFDDTPIDYQPVGFRHIDKKDSLMKKLDSYGNSVTIGNLFTGFHRLKCRGRGAIFNLDDLIETSMEIESPIECKEPEKSLPGIDLEEELSPQLTPDGLGSINFTEEIQEPAPIQETCSKSIENNKNLDSTFLTQCIDISSDDESEFFCMCGIPFVECTVDKITCTICSQKYHAPCQGYLDVSFTGDKFECIHCKGEDQSGLNNLDYNVRKSLYRLRYILGAMYKYGKLPDVIRKNFKDTINNFEIHRVFEMNHNEIVDVKMDFLNSLFNFNYKLPDLSKFKEI